MGTEELYGIQQREKQTLHQGRKNPRNLGGEQDPRGASNPGVILSFYKLVFWAARRGRESETGAEITSASCQVAASQPAASVPELSSWHSSPRAGRTRGFLCARQEFHPKPGRTGKGTRAHLNVTEPHFMGSFLIALRAGGSKSLDFLYLVQKLTLLKYPIIASCHK